MQKERKGTALKQRRVNRRLVALGAAGVIVFLLMVMLSTTVFAAPLATGQQTLPLGQQDCGPATATPPPHSFVPPTPFPTLGISTYFSAVTPTPSPCTATIDHADNAGFTGFCQGDSQAACDDMTSFFLAWSSQQAIVLLLIGILWAVAGTFQDVEGGPAQGIFAHWTIFLQRLKATLLVCFIAWRLGALLQVVDSLWLRHTGDALANYFGLPSSPPVGFLQDGFVVLFITLIQVLLYWVSMRMVFTSAAGVMALAGFSRSTFGEVLGTQMRWITLLFLALELPTLVNVISWIAFG